MIELYPPTLRRTYARSRLSHSLKILRQLEYSAAEVTRKLQRGALTEIVVRNSEIIALKKRKSATTMRISPFTCGLKGDGPSASFHNIRACLSILRTCHRTWYS